MARVHSKIRNSRKDFLHKLSTDIVRKNQVVYIEDLNTKGMVRNRKLSKSISDSSWGSLVNFLEYKCDWYGRELKKVSPKFTSQDCSHCGYRNKELQLSMRRWDCPKLWEYSRPRHQCGKECFGGRDYRDSLWRQCKTKGTCA